MEIQNGFSFCFIDLLLCYLGIDILEEKEDVCRILDSCWLGQGAIVNEFDGKRCSLLRVKHVVVVNTGRLHCMLPSKFGCVIKGYR